jgi:UDP-2-acetamido-3-amino-2,3-dideoxy-glucuronate N-acetyltransferase
MTKLAVIGVGRWGRNHIRTVHELGCLAAVCSDRLEEASEVGATYDVPALLVDDVLSRDDIEGVIISTPAETHGKIIAKCIDAKKHVLVEKPMVLDFVEAQQLIKRAEEVDVHLMVGHLLSYHPAVDVVKSFVESGQLGKTQFIQCMRLANGVIRPVENVFWDLAVHDIAVLHCLYRLPIKVKHVRCFNHNKSNRCDHGQISLLLGDDINVEISVSWAYPYKRHECIIHGSNGVVAFDDAKPLNEKLSWMPHKKNSFTPFDALLRKVLPVSSELPLARECQHFIETIRTGKEAKTSARNELPVLKCLWDIQRKVDVALSHTGS